MQAEAILAAARLEAEQIKAQALKDAEAEVHELYRAARADGYNGGFTEGLAAAMSDFPVWPIVSACWICLIICLIVLPAATSTR